MSQLSFRFLRSQKPYTPPLDVRNKLQDIFQQVLGTTDRNTPIKDLNKRYSLFVACSEQLQHSIPNSLLHTIETTGDVQNFYETPVETVTPLDKLQNMELPENIHVQYDYVRFHPGITWFYLCQLLFIFPSALFVRYGHKVWRHYRVPWELYISNWTTIQGQIQRACTKRKIPTSLELLCIVYKLVVCYLKLCNLLNYNN